MRAWHFVGPTLRDGRPVPADGVTLVHDGPVMMCRSGFHASRRLFDALQYALGSTICRVVLGGVVQEDEDKVVARERTILWRVDGETLLRDFARRCALDVIHMWDAPDIVSRYLKTGDESMRAAARNAARTAAWDAAWDAAWTAARTARDAAGAAMGTAEGDVAWYAARAAARAAAWAATGDAERALLNRRLTAMVSAAPRVTS